MDTQPLVVHLLVNLAPNLKLWTQLTQCSKTFKKIALKSTHALQLGYNIPLFFRVFPFFKQLPITSIDLEHFTADFDVLEKLRHFQLKELTLPNRIFRIQSFVYLKYMPLTKLSFYGCSAISNSVLSHLSEIYTLRSLNLSTCFKITDRGIQFLQPLNLTELDLSCCPLTDKSIYYVQHMPLQKLNINHCHQITCTSLSTLQPTLQWLFATGCKRITASIFTTLKSMPLFGLDLGFCHQLNNSGFQHFTNLPSLEYLNLKSIPQVRSSTITYLRHSKLRFLRLSFCCNITDHAFISLSTIKHLETLFLDHCLNFSNDALWYIRNLPLRYLSLCGCTQLTNNALFHIRHLQLVYLNLSSCSITDEGLVFLQHMPLKHLDCSFCLLVSKKVLFRFSHKKQYCCLQNRKVAHFNSHFFGLGCSAYHIH